MRWMAIDNAVPEGVCTALVEAYRANIDQYGWKNKVGFWSYRLINAHDLPAGSALRTTLREIGDSVIGSISREWKQDASIQVSQLVSWPAGTSQGAHTDSYFSDTRFAAILYLNADYAGGETFLDLPEGTRRIKPETGRLLVFEGSLIPHGVEEISEGNRYTNAMWLS